MAKKILVALSGGVDSAVAAYLLQQQGYEVHGIFFRSWQNETELWKECPWKEDLASARSVAEHLKISFEIINFIDVYRKNVVDYLIEGYRSGQTPNPDVMCNRFIKFGMLVDHMNKSGFDGLATGHYCRKVENNGHFSLLEGLDPNKDQSFFLCLVKRENLSKVLFPLGEITKKDVRRIASDIGLPNAQRKDSQGICFLGSSNVNINQFLEKYIPDMPGDIANLEGKILGKHRGLHRYTIGQRKGIDIPSNCDFEHYVVKGAYSKLAGSEEIFKKVRLSLVKAIKNAISTGNNKLSLMNDTYFIGGTAFLLREEIKEVFGAEYCKFCADNYEEMKFANARGFYKMLINS